MANDTRTHQVSLGCGTLILIALIVMFFSNRGNQELPHEIDNLRSEVRELKASVEAQTTAIKLLETKIDKLAPTK